MSAWRTDPNTPVRVPHLADKYAALGWDRLYPSEQRRIHDQVDEVCQHLPRRKINALAKLLGITWPTRRSTNPIPSRGKDALMERTGRHSAKTGARPESNS